MQLFSLLSCHLPTQTWLSRIGGLGDCIKFTSWLRTWKRVGLWAWATEALVSSSASSLLLTGQHQGVRGI